MRLPPAGLLPALGLLALVAPTLPLRAGPPVYLWHEPEWFSGVEGSFAYWPGTAKATGAWGVAGPGISAEWTQGGESEWNSAGAPADETRASCHRDLIVPRAGHYTVWVRFVEHRKKRGPFTVAVDQGGKEVARRELGVVPVLSPGDEYQLYWGFSFAWDSFPARLAAGPARVRLLIDRKGEAWRQVDALLLTDDPAFTPHGREKPPFAYFAALKTRPADGAAWRGQGLPEPKRTRPALGGKDFALWVTVEGGAKWWAGQKPEALSAADLFYQHATPPDIRAPFHKQYPRPADAPLLTSPHLLPGFYLGTSPDLTPGSPLRAWLARTKSPFYVLTNYASGAYTAKDGPATHAALTGPLAGQFLGYVHGEAIGTGGVGFPDKPAGKTRREVAAALPAHLRADQAKRWSDIYKTRVAEDHWDRGISCLSVDCTALAHLFAESGARVLGYEEDATNYHVPMRVAFLRGAARQYGAAWINYASGNFGDACNYFTQEPRVPRGAKGWWHSKYAVTDGVSASWYRKMYYLHHLGGASAVFWEQGLENQWILPGPGTHPVQLSPFGRGTEDFVGFLDRLPDRGDPITPVAFLLSHAHGYEPVNYRCRMLHHFGQDRADLELRELFNVAWFPAPVAEGRPAAPDVQSLPAGVFGNIFDVLVDRPARARAIFDYPVVWAAGDVDLSGAWPKLLTEYVTRGGTLVVNVEAGQALPPELLGLRPAGRRVTAERWRPEGGKDAEAVPFEVEEVTLGGARVLAWAGDRPLVTRHAVGRGAVVVTLVPRLLGLDERAHPALAHLMAGLTQGLLPVEVCRADGSPLEGEVMYQVNRTKDGYLVLLLNNRGVDKTQHGVARVDRRLVADVVIRTRTPVKAAREWTGPGELTARPGPGGSSIAVRVPAGDLRVVGVATGP